MPPGAHGAGRVVAGQARGIRLVAPGEGTRPLGDRLKQSLFAMLEPAVRERPFLDLFAGSGAGGIEALSRGASGATFVESARVATTAIERNLAATRLAGAGATVVRSDALAWLDARGSVHGGQPAAPFAVVLVDPPYDRPELLEGALQRIARAGPGRVLAGDGLAVVKHASRTAVPDEIGLLRSVRERRFGESMLTLYRWSGAEAG
jgi:16S rRNA (guanine966-N2)-methyltransferase